ncbi:MAG: SIS domain-containing protein, partial [Anaerovoracaceae bacterium]
IVDDDTLSRVVSELEALPDKIEYILTKEKDIENIARKIYKNNNVFYIGRGLDCAVAYEGSLKLKEISYINSFAIAAGELKHGTIALMEPGTLVISLATQEKLYEKMISNIVEVQARGAFILGISKVNTKEIEKHADEVIYIPHCIDDVVPVLSVIPLQILAYHIARLRGCNIDKPKNLAKSVTVE